jgi:hypothetical protein
MKKILVITILIVVGLLVGVRLLAGRITVEVSTVEIALVDTEGHPLGIAFDPLSLRDSWDSLGDAFIGLEANVIVQNPNPIGFSLSRVDFTITMFDQEIGSGTFPGEGAAPLSIPGGEDTPIRVRSNLPISDAFPSVIDILTSGGIEYTVSGTVVISAWVGNVKVPFQVDHEWSPL